MSKIILFGMILNLVFYSLLILMIPVDLLTFYLSYGAGLGIGIWLGAGLKEREKEQCAR